MTTTIKLYLSSLTFILILTSCSLSDTHREQGEMFHAAPMSGGIGALYFGLYNDDTYQICNSGGLGQDCYSGKFKLDKDTLTLLNLNKEIPLKSNKLFIIRYVDQDSNYWKWKYPTTPYLWQDSKWIDSLNGLGDVYQLGSDNKLLNGNRDQHFIIRFDSLKNYR